MNQAPPAIATAAATAAQAKARKALVNPRFTARATKADLEPKLLTEAIELSQASDAPEDKQNDYDFELANKPGGPADKFYKYNAISYGLSQDPKFISKEALADAWKQYAQANPVKVPKEFLKKVPWSGLRKVALKTMLDSGKVPSEFKLQILRDTRFL